MTVGALNDKDIFVHVEFEVKEVHHNDTLEVTGVSLDILVRLTYGEDWINGTVYYGGCFDVDTFAELLGEMATIQMDMPKDEYLIGEMDDSHMYDISISDEFDANKWNGIIYYANNTITGVQHMGTEAWYVTNEGTINVYNNGTTPEATWVDWIVDNFIGLIQTYGPYIIGAATAAGGAISRFKNYINRKKIVYA